MKILYTLSFVTMVAGSSFAQCTTGDCENGKGRYVYSNGDRYIGEFKEGQRQGRGIYHYKNGNIYNGQFRANRRHGYGTYKWTNGDIYKGEYVDNKREGAGTYYYHDGSVQEGSWANGEFVPAQTIANNTTTTSDSGSTSGTTDVVTNTTVERYQGKILKALSGQIADQPRTALVIGNGEYPKMPLKNPLNDANSIAQELQQSGFDVILYTDASQKNMKSAIRDFGQALKEKGGVGLFFYAGHGLQVDGHNYLVPTDADIRRLGDIEYESVDLGRVLVEMEYAKNNMNIVILDACRDNPYKDDFEESERTSGHNGLASVNTAPYNTLVAFSTAPGYTAHDGDGENGLYTQELLKMMQTKDVELSKVFKQVRSNVRKQSEGQQIPWETSSIEDDFYFKQNQ